jgi:hypothetical protein
MFISVNTPQIDVTVDIAGLLLFKRIISGSIATPAHPGK